MGESSGKQSIGRQARFVRAALALGEALEQRHRGLGITQMVIKRDDIAAEALCLLFLEQIAEAGQLEAIFRAVPAVTDLAEHLHAELQEFPPVLLMLLFAQGFGIYRRVEPLAILGGQKRIQVGLRANGEVVAVQRFEDVARHQGLPIWLQPPLAGHRDLTDDRCDDRRQPIASPTMLAAGAVNPWPQGDFDVRSILGLVREQLGEQTFAQASRSEDFGRQHEEFIGLARRQGAVAVLGISQGVSPVAGQFERVIIHRRSQRNL